MLLLLRMLPVLCLFLYMISCDNSSEPTSTTLRIDDVWIGDIIDTDEDGYISDANVYFNLITNTNNLDVFVELGIRETTDNPDEVFELCFRSAALTLVNNDNNLWYIPIHTIDYQIEQRNYDFLLQVYQSNNPDNLADEVSPAMDNDIYNISLEPDTTDLYKEWISYIDDDIVESGFSYYPRFPVGAYYTSLAEKFEKPLQANYFKLLEIRVNIPNVYSDSPNIGIGLMDDNDNEPNENIGSNMISGATSGWNQIEWEHDLTDYDVFYLSIAPTTDWSVGLDTNSVTRNGYGRWYSSGNPPQAFWREWDNNIAFEIYVGYSVVSGFARLNPEAKLCRRKY